MGLIRGVRSGICATPAGSASPKFGARSTARLSVAPLPDLSILCYPQFRHLGADPTRSGYSQNKRKRSSFERMIHDVSYL